MDHSYWKYHHGKEFHSNPVSRSKVSANMLDRIRILFWSSKLHKLVSQKCWTAWKCTFCFKPETVFRNRLIFLLFRNNAILYIENWIWGFEEYSVRSLSWGKMKRINWLVLSLSLNPHRIRKYSKFHSEDDLDCINRNLSKSSPSEEAKSMPIF